MQNAKNTNLVYEILDSEKTTFEWLKSMRKYANSFEAPNKKLKEITVSSEWLKTYGVAHGYNEESFIAVDDQDRWPDCEVKMTTGKLCGIEVTELVDSECIKLNEKNNDVYCHWSNEDIIDGIEKRLREKNTRSHGGKYQKLIVLIHTDEFEIDYDTFNKIIIEHEFSGLKNIDEAYLVYSYDPRYKHYPVSVLKLSE